MNRTKIEWTDYTWNPVTGCTKVSQGCKFCYAETLVKRFGKAWGKDKFTNVECHEDRLDQPLTVRRPSRVFVCDMSDLFHEDVPFEFIAKVFCVMASSRHTYQVLTKRPERAIEFFTWDILTHYNHPMADRNPGPLKNVWIGVSVEDQATANQRIPLLLQIPAAVKFLSCEPLLGPIDLTHIETGPRCSWVDSLRGIGYGEDPNDNRNYINWVICGGESGPKARPMRLDWVRSLRDQCRGALVPFFFKQWGEWLPLDDIVGNFSLLRCKYMADGLIMYRLGKSKSGNMLDGKQHLEFPPF